MWESHDWIEKVDLKWRQLNLCVQPLQVLSNWYKLLHQASHGNVLVTTFSLHNGQPGCTAAPWSKGMGGPNRDLCVCLYIRYPQYPQDYASYPPVRISSITAFTSMCAMVRLCSRYGTSWGLVHSLDDMAPVLIMIPCKRLSGLLMSRS